MRDASWGRTLTGKEAASEGTSPTGEDAPAYVNGVSEELFKVGMCLPAGPCVTDEDVRYIVECMREAIVDEG